MNLSDPRLTDIFPPPIVARRRYRVPYILRLHNNQQELLYFGVRHSRDPDDPQLKQIAQALRQFAKRHRPSSCLVVLENFKPEVSGSKSEMIRRYGETGLLAWLAHDLNLTTRGRESDFSKQIDEAQRMSRCSSLEVSLWLLLNGLHHLFKTTPSIPRAQLMHIAELFQSIDQLVGRKRLPQLQTAAHEVPTLFAQSVNRHYLQPYRRYLRSHRLPLVIPDQFEAFGQKRFPSETVRRLQHPFVTTTPLNRAGASINLARDRIIAARMVGWLERGFSLFAVFGANHVMAQRSVFERYFSKKKGRRQQATVPLQRTASSFMT